MTNMSVYCINAHTAAQIYAQGTRDYSFASEACLEQISQKGKLLAYGDVSSNKIAIGGIAPINFNCALTRAAKKTGLCGKNTVLILPILEKCECEIAPLLDKCLSLIEETMGDAMALVPIISGEKQLCAYFKKNMCIVALRPLHALRPYYILQYKKAEYGKSIIISKTNTYTISRLLESGYIVVDMQNDGMILKRGFDYNENSDFGKLRYSGERP
ncbi:MAG: hypothetical protein RR654_04090 [Oscillospiraceae bacterium]